MKIYKITDTVKAIESEDSIQKRAEALLVQLGIPYVRIPSVILSRFFCSKSVSIWHKRDVAKYLSGIPDLMLFDKKKGTYKAIEIKTEKGRASPKQKMWIEALGAVVTKGWEETKVEILAFHQENS